MYIIMDKQAYMPASAKSSSYRKVAVVEVEDDFDGEPAMISNRARGVIRIVDIWDRVYKGKTSKCAYARALHEAEELLETLLGDTHD